MQLSAPIYALKRKAKLLTRGSDIALHQALNKIAIEEGFQSWSHLVSSSGNENPGQGKTLLGLELAGKASEVGRKGYFFTLDYHERDIANRFSKMGIDPNSINETVVIDTSDDVSADHVINRLKAKDDPALIVLDYMQLLDKKRTNQSIGDQNRSLQKYVIDAGAICAVISQIDRSFDLSGKSMPDISDVRLPNPFDLSVFRKLFFLHDGKIQFDQAV